jgi:hypothetical protein
MWDIAFQSAPAPASLVEAVAACVVLLAATGAEFKILSLSAEASFPPLRRGSRSRDIAIFIPAIHERESQP